MCFLGLASVVGCQIKSVYQKTFDVYEELFTGCVEPRQVTDTGRLLSIMWSTVGPFDEPESRFIPNHFVPVLIRLRDKRSDLKHQSTPFEGERPLKIMKLDGRGPLGKCLIVLSQDIVI